MGARGPDIGSERYEIIVRRGRLLRLGCTDLPDAFSRNYAPTNKFDLPPDSKFDFYSIISHFGLRQDFQIFFKKSCYFDEIVISIQESVFSPPIAQGG